MLIQQNKKKGGKLSPTTQAGKKDLGKWDGKVGKMRPGRTGEMRTRVKNKTFTYE